VGSFRGNHNQAARRAQTVSAKQLQTLTPHWKDIAAMTAGRDMTLVVDTADGIYLRRVRDASILAPDLSKGPAAELATRSAVATWGLPDFVYEPSIRRVGSGERELGDGILVVGRRAVVIQVKSRDSAQEDAVREARWIQKQARAALQQGRGTIRQLRRTSAGMVNGRGRAVDIDGTEYEWLAVGIIDHPDPPEAVTVPNPFDDLPAIVMLRRDWEFLFNQLRSTHWVVDYLFRAQDMDPVPLGDEPSRYYQFALADAEMPPSELPEALTSAGTHVSVPRLPLAPAGSDGLQEHLLLRVMMEDIATSPLGEELQETHRREALADLDRLPVAHRTELGSVVRSMLADVVEAKHDTIVWRFRNFRFTIDEPQLIFGACSRFDKYTKEAFFQHVAIRHHDLGQSLSGLADLTSIGVLLTPLESGKRPWDTTMVRISGDLGHTPDELQAMRELWSGRGSVGPDALDPDERPADHIQSVDIRDE
jgi:hypothetical protein